MGCVSFLNFILLELTSIVIRDSILTISDQCEK